MIKITINNKEYNVKKDLTILQACEQFNIIVPRFCYHEKLSVAGNCRMCLVEVNKSPKPVASCAMPLMPNMVIYTETPLVKKAREAVLEFLLINHPLDCPICDQGGECDLQDITLNYGSDRSRFFELKRGVEDKECGPIIKTIMTRCIHCTRCIRFISEIAGLDCLGTLGRGENTEIGTYINKFIKTELSGNLVDLCPVGALTSKPYAFSTRTWELKKFENIDFSDSMGSNIVIYTRNNAPLKNYKFKNDYENKDEILRILPKLNDNINENWISDKTRYAFDGFKYNRSKNIKIKNNLYNNKTINWSQLLSLKVFKDNNKFKNNIGFIGSINDIESLFFFRTFLKTFNNNELNLLINNKINSINTDLPNFYHFNSKFKAIDSSDVILLVGLNPRYESSMLNVRIRKQMLKKNVVVASIGSPNDLTYKTYHLGSSTKNLINIAEGKHWFCKKLKQSKNPLIIVGSELNDRKDSGALTNLLRFIGKKSLIHLKNYNGFNNIHLNLSQTNCNELNIKPSFNSQLHLTKNKNLNINYFNTTSFKNKYLLLNADINKEDIYSENSEIISLSTHKLFNIKHKLNYTIPTTGHFEKNNLNINSEGTIQKSFKSVSPPVDARNVDDILKAFIKLNYENNSKKNEVLFKFTNKNLIKKNPFLNKLNNNRESFYIDFLNIKETQNKIYLNNFKSVINNFYMTDIISKNSQIMAECSLFMNNKYNFIKNNI